MELGEANFWSWRCRWSAEVVGAMSVGRMVAGKGGGSVVSAQFGEERVHETSATQPFAGV
uniref:Uncharacterized protein n=1 Tax=Oryza sativa subsp. japonica TaxID=39947 RepID=Q10RQ5_ORYSJ|nr:hypothetical protein LOC_Os03g05580 [Oryza sativa Japonica Group]